MAAVSAILWGQPMWLALLLVVAGLLLVMANLARPLRARLVPLLLLLSVLGIAALLAEFGRQLPSL